MIFLVEDRTNSLTVPATVKHNGVTVETQQLRYRRAQETLQSGAAGNLTNDAAMVFTFVLLGASGEMPRGFREKAILDPVVTLGLPLPS